MRFKNILFATAFLVAITAAFGFKETVKKQLPILATFKYFAACNVGPVDGTCNRGNTGPQCTTYYNGTWYNAFVKPAGGSSDYPCQIPLYQPF